MIEDAALLRRYATDRSEEAFSELVRRHVDLVYGAALRQLHGNVHRAEDVTQSVFADLAKKAGKLSRHSALAGWLYLSAHHASAALMRAEARREAREQEAWTMNQDSDISSADWTRLRPALEEALRALPDRDRAAILLRFFEQRPFRDVGAVLGLSEDAARRRTDRALDRLRATLARHGITSTAAMLAAGFSAESALAAPAGLAASVTQSVFAASAAVASATGAAGTGTAGIGHGALQAVLGLMSTTKIVVGLGIVLLLVCAGGAGEEFLRNRQLSARLVAAETDQVAASERARHLQSEFEALPKSLGAPQRTPAAAAAKKSGSQKEGYSLPKDAEENSVRLRSTHPEVQAAFDRFVQSLILQKYADLLHSLTLTPEQIARFVELKEGTTTMLTRAGNSTYSFTTKLNEEHLTPPPPQAEAELQAMLGPEAYQALQDYDAAQPERDLVAAFAGMSVLERAPLSTSQVNRVAQSIENGATTIPAPSEDVLGAQQLAALQAIQARSDFFSEMNAAVAKSGQEPSH